MGMNNQESFFERNRKAIAITGFIVTSLGWFVYALGPKHIPHHVETLLHDIRTFSFSRFNTNSAETDTLSAGTAVALSVGDSETLESPLDTVMWLNAIKRGDYIPEQVMEELERVRKRNFTSLTPAQDFPTDEEAQAAILYRYNSEVNDLLIQYKAHIRIGKCFSAPLQAATENGNEIARVTAMVSAFNDQSENLGNIQRPLDIIYDFVKFESDPGTWYITDFSQSIPYDYALNKQPF
jgi:hypothetical protein